MALERKEAIKALFNPFYFSAEEWVPAVYKDLSTTRIGMYASSVISAAGAVAAWYSETNSTFYGSLAISGYTGTAAVTLVRVLWDHLPQVQEQCSPPTLAHRVKQRY